MVSIEVAGMAGDGQWYFLAGFYCLLADISSVFVGIGTDKNRGRAGKLNCIGDKIVHLRIVQSDKPVVVFGCQFFFQ